MPKTKRIYVEAALSRNFQKYTVGLDLELTDDEQQKEQEIIRQTQAKCRKLAKEQIALDQGR